MPVPFIPDEADLQRLLPESLRGYLGEVSAPGLWALIQARGGSTVRVPKRAEPDHPLAAVLPRQDFAALVRHGGASALCIPSPAPIVRHLRNAAIRLERRAGTRIQALATAHGITPRQVYRILARRDPPATPEPVV